MKAFIGILALGMSFCFMAVISVHAQDVSFGVATYIPINGKDVPNGAIVSSSNQGFQLSNRPYDPLTFGVVTKNPAVSFGEETDPNYHPVLSSGQAYVLVNAENGAFKRGDLLTTSSSPGVAMKAIKSGFVIGSALVDFSPKDKKQGELVPVSININFFTTKESIPTKLLDVINLSAFAASDEPLTVFKYVIVLLIVIFSFIMGLFSFGKIATNGIEALGRNPLAAKMIQVGIIFNVIITITIIAAGIVMALFILRL